MFLCTWAQNVLKIDQEMKVTSGFLTNNRMETSCCPESYTERPHHVNLVLSHYIFPFLCASIRGWRCPGEKQENFSSPCRSYLLWVEHEKLSPVTSDAEGDPLRYGCHGTRRWEATKKKRSTNVSQRPFQKGKHAWANMSVEWQAWISAKNDDRVDRKCRKRASCGKEFLD